MMCFKDMTFCPYWRDCESATTCSRPLTDEVSQAAREWWGGSVAPISVFREMPTCHSEYKVSSDE